MKGYYVAIKEVNKTRKINSDIKKLLMTSYSRKQTKGKTCVYMKETKLQNFDFLLKF